MEFTYRKYLTWGMCELNFRGVEELHFGTGRVPLLVALLVVD